MSLWIGSGGAILYNDATDKLIECDECPCEGGVPLCSWAGVPATITATIRSAINAAEASGTLTWNADLALPSRYYGQIDLDVDGFGEQTFDVYVYVPPTPYPACAFYAFIPFLFNESNDAGGPYIYLGEYSSPTNTPIDLITVTP